MTLMARKGFSNKDHVIKICASYFVSLTLSRSIIIICHYVSMNSIIGINVGTLPMAGKKKCELVSLVS